jgi:hypothetical protein
VEGKRMALVCGCAEIEKKFEFVVLECEENGRK